MRSLAPPVLDHGEVFRAVSASRRSLEVRARLLEAAEGVLAAYAGYDDDPSALVALDPKLTPPATAEDLRRNYDSRSQATRNLRGAMFANNPGGRCCLCAHRKAGTFDHYLPRATYPEFSVLPLNLIPACRDCNHAKGAGYRQDNGEAAFLHAYLDLLPGGERFLYVELELEDGEPTVAYYVKPSATLPDELASRIRSHFDKLELAAYYLFEAVNELGERRGVIEDLWRSGATNDDVRDYLRREADSIAFASGVNHWCFALLDALVARPEIYRPVDPEG